MRETHMLWRYELQRVAAVLGSALFASVLLTGCMPEDSRTALDWYPAADPLPPTHVAAYAPPRSAADTHKTLAPVKTAALDCPVPRGEPGKPAWYTASNLPPPAPVTQPATYTPAPGGTLAFAWPLSGPVVSDFGTSGSGERNDGINIAVPAGTPIHAAAAGEISYAGNELRSYGNLVLIKHNDGYVTAYAHAERLIVNRGDFVTRGQIIGYAGQTGDVTSPQLHFEIRKGVTPVNPRTMLAQNRAS
jgi:murein DD-endopeptidase MepM/ murein hydrolase activator NlpD